jgi:hypothetical protein
MSCTLQVSRADGERLAQDLVSRYPIQIKAIDFEYGALDPPALFIDLDPLMNPDEQLTFLCTEIWPQIRKVDSEIAATVSHGWWTTDCPQT